jgi:hypothetical protein
MKENCPHCKVHHGHRAGCPFAKMRPEVLATMQTELPENNLLAQDVGKLARRHGLRGCVLISFGENRVGINSSGATELMLLHMQELADKLLVAITSGEYDPTP